MFKRKQSNPDEGLPSPGECQVDLNHFHVDNLLFTSGGGYVNSVHSEHIAKSLDLLKKYYREFKYPSWWTGVAYLIPERTKDFDIVWVRAQGHLVDKLTAKSCAQIFPLLKTPVPVKCGLTIIGEGRLERPSVKVQPIRISQSKTDK